MKIEFNPSEYKSYEALPEEEKQNFEAIEGGRGFVLKTIEKNPEVAHRLAIIEDRVINILRQEVEIGNLSFDGLLSQYRTAAEKYNYQEKRKVSELLKQISDYNILRGDDYDEMLREEFKKRYESLTYSEKTQGVLIEGIDQSDLDVGARLLTDEKFSLKTKLLEKIGDNDDSLKKLYGLTQENLNVVNLIVNASENPDTKVDILKDVFGFINKIQNGESKEEKLKDYSFDSMRRHIAEVLVHKGEHSSVLRLIDEGYLEIRNLKGLFHEVDSDQFLYDLASRSKDGNEVTYLFKFIADKGIFSRIIEDSGQSLAGLSEQEKQNKVALAKKFFGALSKSPEIHQVGDLTESNKFVVGIPSKNDVLFLAWSNTDEHKYHKDIFQSLSRSSGQRFPDNLRSGGWIEVQRKEGNQFHIVFSRSSGDFGNYGHRVLSRFKENILKILQEKLGDQNVELEIEVSS